VHLHFPDDLDFTECMLGADARAEGCEDAEAGGCEDTDAGGCKDAEAGGCDDAEAGGAEDGVVVETDRIESKDEVVANGWPSKGCDDVDGRARLPRSMGVDPSCGAGEMILAEDKGAACPVLLSSPFPSIKKLGGAWVVPVRVTLTLHPLWTTSVGS
jgi:hypothetical protein